MKKETFIEKIKKLPKWVKITSIILILAIIGLCIPTNNNENLSDDQDNTTTDLVTEQQEYTYMTELSWTNSGNNNSDETIEWLKVAIGTDDYDGDILEPGTYTVKQTNGEYSGEEYQRIYNLYVTNINTDNPEEVPFESLVATVGGVNGSEDEIILNSGQYLYIQKIDGGEIGHLQLNLKD